jgi:hypothetical protein
MEDSTDIADVVANRFGIIFQKSRFLSPCACRGISCGRLGCEQWWSMVLRDPEIRSKAIDIYTRHKEEIDSGALTLLKKRFLL